MHRLKILKDIGADTQMHSIINSDIILIVAEYSNSIIVVYSCIHIITYTHTGIHL